MFVFSSLYLFSSPSWPNSQSKQSCNVSQHAWCVNKPKRYADGDRWSPLIGDLSQLDICDLSQNKSCLCIKGCNWTISGSTISHQSTSRPLAKWSLDWPLTESFNNRMRISAQVFKGRERWGVHTAEAEWKSRALWLERSVPAMAWRNSSKRGEFAFLNFKQAEINTWTPEKTDFKKMSKHSQDTFLPTILTHEASLTLHS